MSKRTVNITIKNIARSEYLGAIDPEVEVSEENVTSPEEIQGVIYENQITIQNYGNAMNYYVKPGDCEVKYKRRGISKTGVFKTKRNKSEKEIQHL